MSPASGRVPFASRGTLVVVTSRFTIIELMVAVAIVALLTALAVPAVREAALKAKIAETPVNAEGIHEAELAYEAAHDAWVGTRLNPGTSYWDVGRTRQPWIAGTEFDDLGWAPDGDVYCQYMVGTACGPTVSALCDVDGDDAGVMYQINRVDGCAPPPDGNGWQAPGPVSGFF